MATARNNALILCAGLQSSGTTLVSYSFLQRADTNGVLDADNDLLPALDPNLAQPYAWYKTTISSFRLSEIAAYYHDAGWDVRTLLVLRDLRDVWASLRDKPYGRNGITAEDPPLRLRVRRFVEDWRLARASGGAMLRYEDFVSAPTATLQRACADLGIAWDVSMLTWPKRPDEIADRKNGNGSFWDNRSANLMSSLSTFRKQALPTKIPSADLEWLEREFRDYNVVNGYPPSLGTVEPNTNGETATASTSPSFEVTRRYVWETTRKPLRWLLARLGRRNQALIERRSWKRAA
jgi:hypothetical protein